MLEELLRNESASEKKKKLSEEYGIIMRDDTERRLNTMCNLSEVVLERGIEQGIERGIEQGIERGIEQGIERGVEQGMRQLIEQMLNNGKTAEEIAEFCGIPVARIEKFCDKK